MIISRIIRTTQKTSSYAVLFHVWVTLPSLQPHNKQVTKGMSEIDDRNSPQIKDGSTISLDYFNFFHNIEIQAGLKAELQIIIVTYIASP